MKHADYIKLRNWARTRVDSYGLYNRADFAMKEQVATILSREYQTTDEFKSTLPNGANIREIYAAVSDLKEECFALVCGLSEIPN